MTSDEATVREEVAAAEGNPDTGPGAESRQPVDGMPEAADDAGHDEATEAQADGDAGEAEGDGEQVDEEIEFDFGGNKLRVPRAAVPEEVATRLDEFARGIWSDYTRRGQQLADERKSVAAAREAVEKVRSLNDEALDAYAHGLAIKAELQQLSQTDLPALWRSNPDEARRVSDTIAQRQAELQQVASRVQQAEQQATAAQQAEHKRLAEEGEAALERKIKGFREKVPELLDYVTKQYGIDRTHAERVWRLDTATAEMAYKAMQWDRLQAARKAAPAPKPAAPAAPVTAMKARGSARTESNPDKMTTEQFMRWRQQQIEKRAG